MNLSTLCKEDKELWTMRCPLICFYAVRDAYTNRHGYTSQNVIATCDFDMGFGTKGFAHDMRVLKEA